MVKNIPTIERSTKIRFGKNTTDDQGDNTIVLNASNAAINASSGGSLYISPVRLDTGYASKPTVVLMMYNTETKELVESGERASDLIGNQGLAAVTNQGNVTSNVVSFVNNTTALVTQSNVGIANSTPGHTLSVGSNLYIDDTGSKVLVVSGDARVIGDLDVIGNVTAITSNNLIIEDAIIELGKNNTSGDLTLDLGLIMGRPASNVTVGFKEETNEMILAFTESSAYSNTIVPLTSEDINVHVYGRLYTEANVGVLNTNPIHTLDVGSNLYVDEFGSNILVVTGNTNITGDLTVDTDTLFVDSSADRIGINTKTPDAGIHLIGNAYVSSNVIIADTTASSSKTTGAVTIGGGLGVVGDIHATHVNFEDVEADSVTVTDTTTSTSATTGALKVAGGISTQENLNVGAVAKVLSATDASSKTTGALIVTGGVGISKNIHALNANFEDVEADSVNITDTTDASSKTTGALIVAGGVGISKNIHALHANFEDVEADSVTITDTTTSTSATTGALKVAGGISTQENLNVGAVAKVISATDASSKTTGALIVTGGVGISKNIHALHANFEDVEADSVTVTDTTTSTSTTTGALKVAGGISTQENLNVGGTVTSWGRIGIISTTDASSKGTGALIVAGGVGISKNIHALHANFEDVEADSVTITDNTTSSSATTGALKVVGGISTQENLNVGAVAKVLSATDASSKTTGALIVTGGVGISKNIHALHANFEDVEADSVTITDTTTSTSATTGALKVAGGISTQKNLNVGSNAHISSNLEVGTANLFVNTLTSNVGIGTKTPSELLDIAAVSGDHDAFIRLRSGSGGSPVTESGIKLTESTRYGWRIAHNANTDSLKIAHQDQNDAINGDNYMVFKANGNIGIAEADPTSKLQVAGDVNITDATISSSKTTGALKVAGGIGVAGNIHTSNIYAAYDTDATSYIGRSAVGFAGETNHASFAHIDNNTTGNYALKQTEGGTTHVNAKSGQHIRLNINNNEKARITGAGDLKIGSNVLYVDVSETSIGVNTASPEATLHVVGNAYVSSTTDATTTTTGALIVSGGLGIAKTLFAADVSSGSVIVTDNTTSDSATTGALKVTGGISTQENLNVGAVAKVLSTTDASSKTTGALIVTGGVGISKNIHALHANFEDVEADSVTVTDTTTSTSATTGALKVAGGISTQENLNVGAVAKVISATDASSKTTGALIVTGGVGISKNIHALHANFEDVEADSVTVTDTTTSTSATTGALKVAGGISTQENLNVGAVAKVISATDASSKTTGALIVTGGVGISKNIHALDANFEDVEADSVTVTDTTTSTSVTTGALKVAGGISTQENLNVGGTVKVDGDTLVVNAATDRVGVNKAVPAHALDVVGDINFSGSLLQGGSAFGGSPWNTETSPDAVNYTAGNVGIGAADPDATLDVTGNVFVSSNVNTGANVFIAGGLVTNTGGVTKKTYSFTGALDSGQTIANSTIKLTFTAHVFYAKVVAHLIESDNEVSTLSLECGGGHRSGGTPLNVALGPISVFGSASTNPWNSAVAVTTTTIALAPTTNMAAAGNYNVFIEYISAHASGAVTKITEGSTDVITFGY